jgi:hypothetical protein
MTTRFTAGALVEAAVTLSAAALMTFAGYRMLADIVQSEAAMQAQVAVKRVA